MTRRLIVPFAFAVMVMLAAQAFAQGAFPAPLPGETTLPPSNALPLPQTNGTPPADNNACTDEFAPLRAEAEKRGKLLKAASERHAPPDETCKLIGSFVQSEIKMIRYVEANAARCGIPPGIADQLRAGHNNTEAMQTKICKAAQEAGKRGPVGPTGDFDMYVPH
jgi:hypothetical protein